MTPLRSDDVAVRHEDLTDEELLAAVRTGDTGAYAALYRRHLDAALALARRLVDQHEAQDVAQEAFLKVLRAITGGGGPQEGFAPYLMRTVRNEAIDRSRRSRSTAVADLESIEPFIRDAQGDTEQPAEHELVGRALAALSPQWQRILWLTEVDGLAPREAAPLLRRSANAAAQLSHRAREGLRTAWLQAHVDGTRRRPGCQQTAGGLGAYERGQLSAAQAERTRAHLEDCVSCSLALRELQALSARMRSVLLPAVLGTPLLLEELSEVLAPAPQQAAPGVLRAGAPQTLGRRPLPARLTAPVAAAGAAVLVGGAGIAFLSLRADSDPAAPDPAQQLAEPRSMEPVPENVDVLADPAAPTGLPSLMVEEDPAAGAPEGDASDAADGAPVPVGAPDAPGAAAPASSAVSPSAGSAPPAVGTQQEAAQAAEVPPTGVVTPVLDETPTPTPVAVPGQPGGATAPAGSAPTEVDDETAAGDDTDDLPAPPAGGAAPPDPEEPPPVPDPPFLGGTPPGPPDGIAPPEDPAPPEEPGEEQADPGAAPEDSEAG